MFHMSGGIENSAGDKYSSISGGEFFKCEERTDGKDIVKTVCSPIDHDAYFNFHQGIVIGEWNPTCTYGAGIFSVDGVSDDHSPNCPQGNGTVTFGSNNIASGLYSSVTGMLNRGNFAIYRVQSFAELNDTFDNSAIILGGVNNVASGLYSSVSGGSDNKASGTSSSSTGRFNHSMFAIMLCFYFVESEQQPLTNPL